MDHALCRLCGHKHAGVDHVWDTKPVAGIAQQLIPPDVAKPKFDRVAYQRDYMRKDRARKKAERRGESQAMKD